MFPPPLKERLIFWFHGLDRRADSGIFRRYCRVLCGLVALLQELDEEEAEVGHLGKRGREGEREREDAGLGDLWEDGLCGVDGEGGRYREELVIAGRQAGQLGAARTRDLEWWVEVLLETSSWFLTDLVYAGAVLQTPL